MDTILTIAGVAVIGLVGWCVLYVLGRWLWGKIPDLPDADYGDLYVDDDGNMWRGGPPPKVPPQPTGGTELSIAEKRRALHDAVGRAIAKADEKDRVRVRK